MEKNHIISVTLNGKPIDSRKFLKLSIELITPQRNFNCYVRLKKLRPEDIEKATKGISSNNGKYFLKKNVLL